MRRGVDESPLSEFVQKMRAVFARREAATTVPDKRSIEREMEALMRQYLGRSAWDAAAAAAAAEAADVSRDTGADRSCPDAAAHAQQPGNVIERQRRAAGDVD